jgi:hypothetical protein
MICYLYRQLNVLKIQRLRDSGTLSFVWLPMHPYGFLLLPLTPYGSLWPHGYQSGYVKLKLRYIICLLEWVIFSYMGENIWRHFCIFVTLWCIHVKKNIVHREENAITILHWAKYRKIKKIHSKNVKRLISNLLFDLIFIFS